MVVIRRVPRGWPYSREAWQRLEYLNQTRVEKWIHNAREEMRVELRRQYSLTRSAGSWIVTQDKDGRGCRPFPDVEMYRVPTSSTGLKMAIADIEESYPDVHKILICLGFHATFANVGIFGPTEPIENWSALWAERRDLLIWTRP